MSIDYCLRVIRVEDIQWKHPLHSKVPDLYVDVRLHGVCRKTRTIKNTLTPFWDELLAFSSSDRDAIFTIRIRHDAALLSDPNIGFVDVPLEELLARSANGEVRVELRGSSQANSTKFRGVVVLHLEVIDSIESADIQLAGTREDAVSRTIEAAQSNAQGELYQSINVLLSRLKMLEVVTAISEASTYS
ncbi:hypothetical protein ACEPAI_1620 [Sanghuangporus weigelae]